MPRPQFTLRTLLVAMLVVAAFGLGYGWHAIAPKLGTPTHRAAGDGYGELTWWTGRRETFLLITEAGSLDRGYAD